MTLFQTIERKPLPPDYHHPLSASKAKRWLRCPASAAVADSGGTSDAAAFGTKVHEYAERMSRGLLPADIDVDVQAVKSAQQYLDAIAPFLADCDEVLTEYRVYLDNVPTMLFDPLSGTADKVGISEWGPLIVADLKTGYKDIEVEDNDQLDFYALGAYWALLPEVRATITHVTEIIVQVNGRVGCEVKQVKRNLADLLAWGEKASKAVAAAELTPDVFAAGEHCGSTYCPYMFKCKAHTQYLHDSVGTEITELDPADVPEDVPEVERLLDALPTIKAWCKAVEQKGLDLLLTRGEEFSRYRAVASFGHRKFIDDLAFIEAAKKAGVSDLVFDKKLKTPAQLEAIPFVKDILKPDMFFRPSSGHNLKKV